MTRYLNCCSACAVTVVIFGHLNRSFSLYFTYSLHYLFLNRQTVHFPGPGFSGPAIHHPSHVVTPMASGDVYFLLLDLFLDFLHDGNY